jgi:pyruvate carboxylase
MVDKHGKHYFLEVNPRVQVRGQQQQQEQQLQMLQEQQQEQLELQEQCWMSSAACLHAGACNCW